MIKVTQAMRIALAAMIEVAEAPANRSIAARRIAINAGVSQQYLVKILQMLKRGGILQSDTGRKGGYRLCKTLSEISLLDLYTAVHNPPAPNDVATCQSANDSSLDSRSERLLHSIAVQVETLLQSITLHDLLCDTSTASSLHSLSRSTNQLEPPSLAG